MSKLANLYYLHLKNGIWVFLLSILSISTSFTNEKRITGNSIKTIVIDPGHGGKDSGTMGTKRFNIYEKHIALAVSLRLGDYINNEFPDIEVIYTREQDIFLELDERTELANKSDADLFISIHCDGFTSPQPSGASVFVMGMSKLKENMDVAMRENSAIYLEDNYAKKYDGFDPNSTASYIVFSLMQNTYLNQSLEIAKEVEKEFSIIANRKSRGVKQAPFYVISRTNMPSILIECGFLTNPQEEEFLHSDIGQDHIASAIFRAFRRYKYNLEGVSINDNNKIESSVDKNDSIIILEDIKTDKERVIYKVQIGTYLESMEFNDIIVEEQYENGKYKYFVGSSESKLDADNIKLKMNKKGFKGAFIVAFYKGSKISTKEALDLQKKN